MTNKDQQQAAYVELEGSGRGGLSQAELDELVASSDTGARTPGPLAANILVYVALAWSLFQLWISSPLPFMVGFGVFNDTEARAIHLAFALFLAFMAFPAVRAPFQTGLAIAVPAILVILFIVGSKGEVPSWLIAAIGLAIMVGILLGSPKNKIPVHEWLMAGVAAFCAAYIYIFLNQISDRVGAPIYWDFLVSIAGLILLLEATRRALGPPLMIVALVFLIYTFLGPYMPELISHKGNNLSEVVNHHWITTEGVFGIALGVSTSFVFLFVLFGSLLDKAGAGNYFIQVAFSLMGHLRGGPAKAAVVSSGLTGLISGSSIANVVTTGTFTIPLMKRVGFSREQAGAVETAASVNGQIMPPVMGAAAFLMVEYVGIPYFEIVKHAFLPAVISYIALFYIVHLEAVKLGMKGLPRAVEPKPWMQRIMGFLIGVIVLCAVSLGVYYGLGWLKPMLGASASWVITGGLILVYVALVAYAAGVPELEMDDPNKPVVSMPVPGPTIRSGLHYLLPVVVLVWALMVDRLSPGLSAFWASAFLVFILLTQRPLFAIFRRTGGLNAAIALGFQDLFEGLVSGARNMIGIAIATAAAGIIVGAVSQTGVGSALAEVVEKLSGGNMFAILCLTAILSLILGMGLPTTANYIVVSALLAPVIVTLGQQSGLIVPLIAVHLFVFYFGIMADVTPPVGLASFAAAAVSGGDPMKTGLVGFFYSMRTAALPFLFIYNTDLLLINVDWLHGIGVFITAMIAMLLFAAGTMGWFMTRSYLWESAALLLIAFTIFYPGFWMDMIYPPFLERAPAEVAEAAGNTPAGKPMRLRVKGVDKFGEPVSFVVLLDLPPGKDGAERLQKAGLRLKTVKDKVIVDGVQFGSAAKKAGLDWDQELQQVLRPVEQPSKYLMHIPAFMLLGLIIWIQRRRAGRSEEREGMAAAAA
jgi:TRAP transporter 4TM/12TM fusion protein